MRASSLGPLQQFIADALRSDVAVPEHVDLASRADQLLGPSPRGISPAGRLEVYREQYWLRHHANLREDFPTVAWLLGIDAFRQLATGYLQAHPPRTWNLQRLGSDLRAYLAQTPWSSDPIVLDACSLDWAFVEVFDAPDAGPLDLQALAGASEAAWVGARIELHPALRALSLSHPVHDLRDAVRAARATNRPAAAATHVVVWRDRANLLQATPLDAAAFELLSRLGDGEALGAACEAVAAPREPGEAAAISAQVGPWFQQWTASGWVSAVRPGP